jgi:glycosyltransferase involved in cell wall biosynthesis
MNKMPRVSVLAPSYNHQPYVVEAIASLLNQTYEDFELIVIDDASTDATFERIESFSDPRLIISRNETRRGGCATAWKAYHRSQGEYIAFLDTDNVCEPDMLRSLASQLDGKPDLLGVIGLARSIDDDGNTIADYFPDNAAGLNRYELLNKMFQLFNPVCAPAAMIRRKALDQVSFCSSQLGNLHDFATWIALLFLGEVAVIPERVLRFRIRNNDANLSAPRPDTRNRVAFEQYQILGLFLEQINNVELLCKVLPGVTKHVWPLNDRLVPFHMAQLAISLNNPAHRLFGINTLFKMLSNRDTAEYVRESCGFDYLDLYRLAGEMPLLRDWRLQHEHAELMIEHSNLERKLIEQEAICSQLRLQASTLDSQLVDRQRHARELAEKEASLSLSLANLERSRCWRWTSPVRKVSKIIRGLYQFL